MIACRRTVISSSLPPDAQVTILRPNGNRLRGHSQREIPLLSHPHFQNLAQTLQALHQSQELCKVWQLYDCPRQFLKQLHGFLQVSHARTRERLRDGHVLHDGCAGTLAKREAGTPTTGEASAS
eukprot:TRINITY_DN6880_c0_g1_i5.p1 TRINITY_DN6880_c0_g1~~TRINITY_DN6880_c0_g1_i5.p1  ORF type:complete len:124 (+),score=8.12 TRINITY_DN6880_c0_g1_i5:515-886(+)